MRVLDNVLAGVVPRGIVLDLQSIRPAPEVLVDGDVVGAVDATDFYARADANNEILDGRGDLVLESEDEHDVWVRADTGAELADYLSQKASRPSPELLQAVAASTVPCARRERCRTRRYLVLS